jgi:hypothetical protein
MAEEQTNANTQQEQVNTGTTNAQPNNTDGDCVVPASETSNTTQDANTTQTTSSSEAGEKAKEAVKGAADAVKDAAGAVADAAKNVAESAPARTGTSMANNWLSKLTSVILIFGLALFAWYDKSLGTKVILLALFIHLIHAVFENC